MKLFWIIISVLLILLPGFHCLGDQNGDDDDDVMSLLKAAFKDDEPPKRFEARNPLMSPESRVRSSPFISVMSSMRPKPGRSSSSISSSLEDVPEVLGAAKDIMNQFFDKLKKVVDVGEEGEDKKEKSRSIMDLLDSSERDKKKEKAKGSIFSSFNPLIDTFKELPIPVTLSITKSSSNLQGEHICVKEVTTFQEKEIVVIESSGNSTDDEADGDVEVEEDAVLVKTQNSHKCQTFRDASICTTTTSGNGKVLRRIQSCCDGYTTEDIRQNGCTQEIDEKLFQSFNLTKSEIPQNATLLLSKTHNNTFTLPGLKTVHEWADKDVITTGTASQKFLATVKEGCKTEVYLNCALKKETINLENSTILAFDGVLEPAAENLLEAIKSNANLSSFSKVLGNETAKMLQETKQATVFAFTNSAFDQLSESMKNHIMNPEKEDCVRELINQHISSSGSFCSHNLPTDIKSLTGDSLKVRQNGSLFKIEEATIIHPDVFSFNGVVHIIDKVMVREEFLSWRESLKLYNAELAEKLEDQKINTPITIFVPPSDNSTEITNAINYIVSGRLISEFERSTSITTDANSTILTGPADDDSTELFSIRARLNKLRLPSKSRIACSRFTSPSIHSCKAILHFIDKPLPTVNQTVEQFLASRSDLTKFYSLWQRSKVTKRLARITVFAPSDDAFSENMFKKINSTQKKVDDFISRHVVKSLLCGSDVQTSSDEIRIASYSSLNGERLKLNTEEGIPGINNARLEEVELIQSNGIVHILDSFLEKTESSEIFSISSRKLSPLSSLGPLSSLSSLGSLNSMRPSFSPFSLFSGLLGAR